MKTRKNPIIIATLLAMLAITTSACTISGLSDGKISTQVDITLTEDMFNDSPYRHGIHLDNTFDDILDKITRVELNDGFIRYYGTRHQVEGSIDVSVTTEDDQLKVSVIAVNLPGIELNNPIIVRINHELEYELTHMFTPTAEVLFKEVVVEEGAMRMKIQVDIDDIAGPSPLAQVP